MNNISLNLTYDFYLIHYFVVIVTVSFVSLFSVNGKQQYQYFIGYITLLQ